MYITLGLQTCIPVGLIRDGLIRGLIRDSALLIPCH